MSTKTNLQFSLLTLGMAIVLAQPALGQDRAKAIDILKNTAAYYTSADTLSFKADVLFEGAFDGEPQTFTAGYTVALQRPTEIAIHMTGPDIEMNYYTDAVSTTRYIPELQQYNLSDDAIQPSFALRQASLNVVTPAIMVLSEVVTPDPFSAIIAAADDQAVEYVGKEKVNGVDADHIRFEYTEFLCDMWVEDSDTPKVLRIRPDMTVMAEQLLARNHAKKSVDIVVTADMLEQEVGADVASTLTFTPTSDMEKVEQFYRPAPEPEANKLLGKMAPAFTLDLLGGGTLDIASKKGSEIVVLDFWATWCGPCRVAMPIIDKVSKEFAGQGVRLYAVNLEEEAPGINAFLKKMNLDVTVALDSESDVAELYKVSGIPQTVIIGKDGTVQVIHVGVSPNLEDELRSQLAALAKGEVLAK